MDLYANRFVVTAAGGAIDLATGARVTLVESTVGGAADQARWVVRCSELHRLVHPHRARLLDYGSAGEHRRFEAWTGGERPADEAAPDSDGAIRLVDRPAVDAVAEAIDPAMLMAPTAISLWGPPGAGTGAAVQAIARAARAFGLLPIRADLSWPQETWTAIEAFTLLLIARERRAGWTAFVRAAVQSGRPHVLVLVGREEAVGVPSVRLGPVPASDLVAAALSAGASSAIEKAARESGGWPGRFASLVWNRRHAGSAHKRAAAGNRAAEQPAVYGAGRPMVDRERPNGAHWLSLSELAALRRQREAAETLFAKRRHAEAERLLRHVAFAQARREAWDEAVQSGLLLVDAIARRGRVHETRRVLDEIQSWVAHADADAAVADVASRAGDLFVDAGRLDRAAAALAAGVQAARAAGDRQRVEEAVCAGARCDFWRGRYTQAIDALNGILPGSSLRADVRARIELSRCAIGRGDAARGLEVALEAVRTAAGSGVEACVAAAQLGAAFAHLAANDLEAVHRDVATTVVAARRSSLPLLAIRARLLGGEAARRSGSTAAAANTLRRLRAVAAPAFPPIIAARRDLLADLLASDAAPRDIVRRHVRRTNLEALALFVPAAGPHDRTDHHVLHELVEILQACHAAADEARVLAEVSARVRGRLGAAAVAFAIEEHARLVVVAHDGVRADVETGERAFAAAAPIAPHRTGNRIEGAMPVAYGGVWIGALVASWTLAASPPSTAMPLLGVAATAAAPLLAAIRASRVRPSASPVSDIIGTSPAADELRAAIERCAAAPFPVLIDGESGSGKELVARAVHRLSSRRNRAFAALNCAALPDELVEAELFGHARGAFTGAAAERRGAFEDADGGTLFLDEIGELAPRAQAKILRVLQEGELRRLGDNQPRRVDVRVVAATNRDLRAEAAAGRFRTDLLYRLDVLRIAVRPLRDRRDDIPGLADHFWRELTTRVGSRAALAPATLAALARYDWPGNVRELQNVLAALAVRSPKRGLVVPAALPASFHAVRDRDGTDLRLDRARQTFEAQFVRAALVRTGGRRVEAAAELGVTRQGLAKLIARLGIKA